MVRVLRLVAILASVALLSSLYAVWRALTLTGGLYSPVPPILTPGTPGGSVQPASSLLEVRLHYCDGATSYSLLSLPGDATFSMGIAVAETSVANLGTATTSIPVTGPQAPISPGDASAPTPARVVNAACAEAGTVDGRELVLCRGQGPSHLVLTVHAGTGSQAFALALPACGSAGTLHIPGMPETSPTKP
jgi:hypothetical protein